MRKKCQNLLLAVILSPYFAAQISVAQHPQPLKVFLSDLIKAALIGSSQIKDIQMNLLSKDVASIETQAQLTPVLTGGVGLSHQKVPEPVVANNMVTESTRGTEAQIGVNIPTSYGGVFSVSAQQSLVNSAGSLSIPPAGPQDFDQNLSNTSLGVSYRQSLWRNRFGRGYQLQKKSAALSAESTTSHVYSSIQEWVFGLATQYTGAWEIQRRLRSSRKRKQVFVDLLRATELKEKLGTADQADVLQIRASLFQMEDEIAELDRSLMDIWEGLIVSLKLDSSYRDYTSATIEIELEKNQSQLASACKLGVMPSVQTAEMQALEAQLKSISLNMQSIDDQDKPDLTASIGVAFLGSEQQAGESFSSAAGAEYPKLELGLQISKPLGVVPAHSQKLRLSTQHHKIRNQIDGYADARLIEWNQICAGHKLVKNKFSRLSQLVKTQTERLEIQQRRFVVGEIDISQVTTVLSDLTGAEVSLRLTEARQHMLIWRYRKFVDALIPQISSNLVAKS